MKKKEYTPSGAISREGNATSPAALNRLEQEKKEQIEYYFFDMRTNALSVVPPTVDRVDLGSHHKDEYLVKTQKGMVVEIRPFKDEEMLESEMKQNLKERIEKILEKQSIEK